MAYGHAILTVVVTILPLPSDHAKYLPLPTRGRGRSRGRVWINANREGIPRDRGRLRKILAVRDETEE